MLVTQMQLRQGSRGSMTSSKLVSNDCTMTSSSHSSVFLLRQAVRQCILRCQPFRLLHPARAHCPAVLARTTAFRTLAMPILRRSSQNMYPYSRLLGQSVDRVYHPMGPNAKTSTRRSLHIHRLAFVSDLEKNHHHFPCCARHCRPPLPTRVLTVKLPCLPPPCLRAGRPRLCRLRTWSIHRIISRRHSHRLPGPRHLRVAS